MSVDTSSVRESVAFIEAGRCRGEVHLECSDTHSRRVLPALAFLLDAFGLRPVDMDGFVVVVGPGSFTGLRVGLGTVQGLAVSTGRPCVGVSALDALAAHARGEGERVVAVIDAQREEVYVGEYDEAARPLGRPCRVALEQMLGTVPRGAVFVGDGATRYCDLIRANDPSARIVQPSPYVARAAGHLGATCLGSGGGGGPETLVPLYLREAHIRGRQR